MAAAAPAPDGPTTAQVVSELWAALGRARGLSRHRPRLAYDALAVAAGLRAVAMFDYARAAPAELAAALAPLRRAPGFQGGLLVLDGCCYLSDLGHLLQRLETFCRGQGADADADADDGAAGGPALAVVEFGGPAPALAPEASLRALAAQLAPLLAAVERRLSPPRQAGVAWPVIDLAAVPGLPCMPTLNGWLLGYPVVYSVGSYEEAARASGALSAAQLHLFTVRARCAPLGALCGADAAAAAARTRPQAGAQGRGADGGNVLLSFTVPRELRSAGVDAAAAALLDALRRAARRGSGGGGGGGGSGGERFPAGLWGEPTLAVEPAGPGAVSL
ncbi:hypothetical protein Rsub_04503 [Raphidocelis subcapitata]|uniref:Uncharacterized protein n=1 Tax=Raphidocelis subcapitata TaxID=307507 RepID=A0A2V0NX04_9CHLO|nr:hypothetical protein Rsub_04503 [Raphidocelis subcapitata]|eukprot:GBF92156.1 hypothetical protein Rsub_04503 [Raphidocelis subcapitata]